MQEWLARAIEESKQSVDDANRDFFNLWTSGGIRSPFSPADADRIRTETTQDVNSTFGVALILM